MPSGSSTPSGSTRSTARRTTTSTWRPSKDGPRTSSRARIDAIRTERGQIEDTLANAERHLDRGRAVFRHALALLEAPQAAYERGDEVVRSILNKAFFARLYVDAGRIIDHELREPFDVLTDAYATYQIQQGRSALVAG